METLVARKLLSQHAIINFVDNYIERYHDAQILISWYVKAESIRKLHEANFHAQINLSFDTIRLTRLERRTIPNITTSSGAKTPVVTKSSLSLSEFTAYVTQIFQVI